MGNITEAQIQRIEKDWGIYAGTPVKVELIGSALYTFCSHLEALRIAYRYRNSGDKAKVDYSYDKSSWWFRLEL